MGDSVLEITKKGLGLTLIVDSQYVKGIFTDGDLRRLLCSGYNKNDKISNFMTLNPKNIAPNETLIYAINKMKKYRITSLVVSKNAKLIGLLHMYDIT